MKTTNKTKIGLLEAYEIVSEGDTDTLPTDKISRIISRDVNDPRGSQLLEKIGDDYYISDLLTSL